MRTMSTNEVAERLGVSPRRVLAIARARGVEAAGGKLGPWHRWGAGQVAKLRPGKPGRPYPSRDLRS